MKGVGGGVQWGTGLKAWLKLNSIPRYGTLACAHVDDSSLPADWRHAMSGRGHKKWQQQQRQHWGNNNNKQTIQ